MIKLSTLETKGDAIISGSLTIPDTNRSFTVSVGDVDPNENFITGAFFRGVSGFLFDSENNFVGGYAANRPTTVSLNIFSEENRTSLFFNQTIVNNELPIDEIIRTASFKFDSRDLVFDANKIIFGDRIIKNRNNVLKYEGPENAILDFYLFSK